MAFVNNLHTSFPTTQATDAIVIYASISGNAELVAKAVYEGLCEAGVPTDIVRSEQALAADAVKHTLVVLICSTWNVGYLNNYFFKFHAELQELSVPGKHFEIIGLGDSKNYDIFCAAADILEKTVAKIGGIQKKETIRIDGAPHAQLTELKAWGKELGFLISA